MPIFNLYFLVGQSNTGKDTIRAELLKRIPSLKNFVYCTTRTKRNNEVDGDVYFFKTDEEFEEDKKSGKVIEIRNYTMIENGKPREVAYYSVDTGFQGNYIICGTINMCNNYIKYFGRECVIPIFLEVNEKDRLLRGIKREEKNNGNYREVCRRFLSEFDEFSKENIEQLSPAVRIPNEDVDYVISFLERYIHKRGII